MNRQSSINPANLGSFKKTGEIYAVSLERLYHYPAQRVWEAITQPAKLAAWMAPAEIDLVVDGKVCIHLPNGDIAGRITQLEPPYLLEYTWESKTHPGDVSVVRWELYAEAEETCRLIFTHKQVDKAYLSLTAASWHVFLDLLREALNGRNEAPAWPKDAWDEANQAYENSIRDSVQNKASAEPMAIAEMLIRTPVDEVFEAMVNPDITSKIWFTHSSGRLEAGKIITWKWEMYNVETQVIVKQLEKNRFISFVWPSDGLATTVEMTFKPKTESTTFVSITEKGWDAADEKLLEKVAGQTEGWTQVLAALKALLEHGIILSLVADRYPDGFELEKTLTDTQS